MTLQSYLDANNLSKQGLADLLGVSYHVVYRACKGYEPKKKENLEKFLSLGVTFQKNEAPREHIVRGRKKRSFFARHIRIHGAREISD